MIPQKLKVGDEIRVIAPSRSVSIVSERVVRLAKEKLERIGFKVTFGKHVRERDEFDSSSVKLRIDDLHESFADKKVKAILTVIGGYNSNQLLREIDFRIIEKNPKILCGYSDITALQNAIYKKTGLVTYSGPHFSTFGMIKGLEYIEEYFRKCLMNESPFFVTHSQEWSNDAWYLDQNNRKFIMNEGCVVINSGECEGIIIGGNLSTLILLNGTEYMPSLKGSVLFIEDDDESKAANFNRYLQSIIHQPDFKHVKGIVIGRFQPTAGISQEMLVNIIRAKPELKNIPIISNVDFGHTCPMITYPIGGKCRLIAKDKPRIEILTH